MNFEINKLSNLLILNLVLLFGLFLFIYLEKDYDNEIKSNQIINESKIASLQNLLNQKGIQFKI